MELRNGETSNSADVEYDPMQVTRLEPGVLLPRQEQVSVVIIGTNLLSERARLWKVYVGGYACSGLSIVNSSAYLCTLNDVDAWSTRGEVDIFDSSNSSVTFTNVFEGLGVPVVDAVDPLRGSTANYTEVTVSGFDFPSSSSDLVGVIVGDQLVLDAQLRPTPPGVSSPSSHVIVARFPPGAGRGIPVQALFRTVNSSEADIWSYFAPTISSITPRYVFAG